MGGSTWDRVLAPQRGSPRTFYLRGVSMHIWSFTHPGIPTIAEAGRVFGRSRSNVRNALAQVEARPLSREILGKILARLGA